MINHARTLLLNTDGAAGYDGNPGDEFIPPAYRAVTLPSFLKTVRDTIFGPDPDRILLNYRGRQIMGLLHSTELAEFVTELDSRITYDILPLDSFFDELFTGTITPLVGTTQTLYIQGRVDPKDSLLVEEKWLVSVQSGSICRVTRLNPPYSVVDNNYTITDGLSSAVPLQGSALSIKFSQGVGSQWMVRSAVRPGTDLATLMAELDAITEDVTLELFGIGSSIGATEPFLTFRNLYKQHPELAYRMGGIVLALIYRTDQLLQ